MELQLHGWKSRYVPQCIVYHNYATTGQKTHSRLLVKETESTQVENFSITENLGGGIWSLRKKAYGLMLTLRNEGREHIGQMERGEGLRFSMTKGRVKSFAKLFSVREST